MSQGRITQMEVYPTEIYQSNDLIGTSYNRKFVEGYAFYYPMHPREIIFIQVEMQNNNVVPKKDPVTGHYTYVICRADINTWIDAFGNVHCANIGGVNFWFLQKPVDDLIPIVRTLPNGTRLKLQ